MKREEITRARQLAGLTQTALAEKVGISVQAMNGYENGNRTLGPKLLPLVAQALDVLPAYLRGEAPGLPVMNRETGEITLYPIMRIRIIGQGAVYTIEATEGTQDVPLAAVIIK